MCVVYTHRLERVKKIQFTIFTRSLLATEKKMLLPNNQLNIKMFCAITHSSNRMK